MKVTAVFIVFIFCCKYKPSERVLGGHFSDCYSGGPFWVALSEGRVEGTRENTRLPPKFSYLWFCCLLGWSQCWALTEHLRIQGR